MQFKDAAYEVLKEVRKPLHYSEITARALKKRMLRTSGKTPHATMGAMLYTDTLNDNSRFQREGKGKFALRSSSATEIGQQIKSTEILIRQGLRNRLLQMPPQKFEELIRALLELMGFEETVTTPYANDRGVDVRGVLRTNQLTPVRVAIQAKRWKGNVRAREVRELRGSLRLTGEHGIMMTSKDFGPQARKEAQAEDRIPITLIDGDKLVSLLFEHKLGIKEEQYTVRSIDSEYWREGFGVDFGQPRQAENKKSRKIKINFPIQIQGNHKGEIFNGELLDIKGVVKFRDREYRTPTTAAKVVVTNWKGVNGWNFWRYLNTSSGKWEEIGKLRR